MIEDDPICHLSGRVSQEAGREPISGATVSAVAVFDPDIHRSAQGGFGYFFSGADSLRDP